MSNDSKNANMKEHGTTGKNDANRPDDTTQKTGQQSQDALRHQQDATHHKSHKGPQQGAADNESGQQSQAGSQKQSGGMKQGGSTTNPGDHKPANGPGHKSTQSK
jgi:hypothetical protein